MALRHAVLAALLEGEASGYQLAKRFDISVSNFWSATPQQLYRELDRLEQDELIEGRVVEQQGRPNKRVFTLTAAGREQLHVFTAQPSKPTAIRDDLLVKIQAADESDLDAIRKQLLARLDHARRKLAVYDDLQRELRTDRVGPKLTLLGGRMFEEQNIAWCTAALEMLDQPRIP